MMNPVFQGTDPERVQQVQRSNCCMLLIVRRKCLAIYHTACCEAIAADEKATKTVKKQCMRVVSMEMALCLHSLEFENMILTR